VDETIDTGVRLPPGGLAVADVERALAPFGESRMLPPASYTSPDVFRWELRHLFAASWTCVGRDRELRRDDSGAPITQRAVQVGDIGVVLVWATPEAPPAAFANTCRHRAHELLPANAVNERQSIVCPYHAWTYDLAGCVRQAPGFRESGAFDPAEHALVSLPVQVWGGWLFVHAASHAPPRSFAEHVGALDDVLAPYAPERLTQLAAQTYEVAANWKVLVENYHECYHCPLIHPELCQVTPPTSGVNYDLPGAWVGGAMDLRPDAETMSLDGRSGGVGLPGVDPRRVEYLGLLPNLLISAHPDYVLTHRLTPLAADRTRVDCAWLFARDDIDPAYAVEFWDVTNRQDWAACESVQRGLSSPHARPGPLAPNEDAVYQFVTHVARAYLTAPAR
jgi:Rieske 2Fe-2S family protein